MDGLALGDIEVLDGAGPQAPPDRRRAGPGRPLSPAVHRGWPPPGRLATIMPHAPWPLATTTAISWRPYVDGLALGDIEVLDGAGPQAPPDRRRAGPGRPLSPAV